VGVVDQLHIQRYVIDRALRCQNHIKTPSDTEGRYGGRNIVQGRHRFHIGLGSATYGTDINIDIAMFIKYRIEVISTHH